MIKKGKYELFDSYQIQVAEVVRNYSKSDRDKVSNDFLTAYFKKV